MGVIDWDAVAARHDGVETETDARARGVLEHDWDGYTEGESSCRFCGVALAQMYQGKLCPNGDRDDWPHHQPIAPDAPIPGRQWFGGCDPDLPRVRPNGICEGCGERACPVCGAGFYPDGGCRCSS